MYGVKQDMKKHAPAQEMKKELDNMLSKINALELVASDEYQKGTVKVLRALTEGQIHAINEFEHLKKAIDLVTLQLFDVQKAVRSNVPKQHAETKSG